MRRGVERLEKTPFLLRNHEVIITQDGNGVQLKNPLTGKIATWSTELLEFCVLVNVDGLEKKFFYKV